MLDIKILRTHPNEIKQALARRGDETVNAQIEHILDLDSQRRAALAEVEQLKKQRNEASQQVAKFKQSGEDASTLIAETRQIGEKISAIDADVREIEATLEHRLLEIPNAPHESTPDGLDESQNVEVASWGEKRTFDFAPQPHWEIGEALGILDIERGAKISGSRFYVLKGAGAKLERALVSFMLDVHTNQHGYEEIFPPFLVRSECMAGTGQLPKFGDDAYHIEEEDLWLVPTAEVPVTNLHRDEILDAAQLPIKYTAYSACFRREAGAAGRDTRGIIRVHQFNKVEMVKFATPETSFEELEALRRNAETILELLQIPYRTVALCAGDIGFSSAKTYDVEVWFPSSYEGKGEYREISSCSNFESFQARRANIRYRPLDEKGKPGKPDFVHTLNGSGLAVGRTFAAVLENYQNADGSVTIPEVLRPYMGGMEKIEKK
jgi:seryl-tRNA synthetase